MKGGSYCCTLNKTHVTCVCNSYKYDSVCKQARYGRVKSRTSNTSKCTGKKGHKAKNPWRASHSRQTPASTSHQNTTQAPEGFTPAVHHNDKPFVVTFIDDALKAQECQTCKTGFIRRTKILPFDIVLGHEDTKWVPSATTTTKYYCIRKHCITERFPYFNVSFLEVPSTTKETNFAFQTFGGITGI